ELLRRDADRRAGGTGPDTGRSPGFPRTHVAFDRALGRLHARLVVGILPLLARLARPRPHAEQQPRHQAGFLVRHLVHPDHIIGAVALTVAAADAGVVDEHLPVRPAMDRVGRAVGHAIGVLAVP